MFIWSTCHMKIEKIDEKMSSIIIVIGHNIVFIMLYYFFGIRLEIILSLAR